MSEDRIVQALHALAEKDRGLQAASQTEALLVREFRRRRANGGRRRVSVGLTTGVVAAGIAVTAFVVTNRPSPAHRQPTAIPRVAAISTIAAAPPVHVAPPVHAAPPVAVAVTHKVVRKSGIAEQGTSREMVTEFFPLMDPAPPFDRGQLLRVRLPAAAMRSVGLPVGEEHLADPIQADVLVGEEGMPRAMRFVGFETQ